MNSPACPSAVPSSASRRQWLVSAAGLVAAFGLPLTGAIAQITGLADAINKAGRQRMLSQRMAKAWLAVGQGAEAARAQKVLNDSMALFDRQFYELKAYAPTAENKSLIASIEPVWSEYKSVLVGTTPDRNAVARLLSLDANVLSLAQQGTVQLEKQSSTPAGRLVNLAGRQRMLSQRAAKFYLVLTWQAPVPQAQAEVEAARKEFSQALTQLYESPEATQAVRDELDLARQQWVLFEDALKRGGDPVGAPRRAANVFTSSENMLEIMDRVTGLYTRLAT